MGDYLKEQLKQAYETVNTYKSDIKRIEELEQIIWENENQLSHLEKNYKKEESDVKRLEKSSLSSIFYKVTGKYDETLAKETSQARSAKSQLTQKQWEIAQLKEELASLKNKWTDHVKCEERFKQLFDERLTLLKQDNPLIGGQLNQLETTIQAYEAQIKEIKEAYIVGNQVLEAIQEVNKSLNKAAGWGTADLLGGGLLTDLAKHSHIDDAKRSVQEVNRLMSRFKTELADVNQMHIDIQIEIGDFAKFADFFFDGIFADLHMQNRIKEAQSSALSAQRQVASVCQQLDDLSKQLKVKIEMAYSKREHLVIEA